MLHETFGFTGVTLGAGGSATMAHRACPPDQFVVLHAPRDGNRQGHVHLLEEIDQFVGRGYLVTVHGPLNPDVPPERALVETRAVQRRIKEGRLQAEDGATCPPPSCPHWPAGSGLR